MALRVLEASVAHVKFNDVVSRNHAEKVEKRRAYLSVAPAYSAIECIAYQQCHGVDRSAGCVPIEGLIIPIRTRFSITNCVSLFTWPGPF